MTVGVVVRAGRVSGWQPGGMDETQVERTCRRPGCGRVFGVPPASRRQYCRASCRQRVYEAKRVAAAIKAAAEQARSAALAQAPASAAVPVQAAPVPDTRSRRRGPTTLADVRAYAEQIRQDRDSGGGETSGL